MPPINITPQQKSPYDFLASDPRKQRRSFPLAQLSFRKKILVLGGGAAIIMIIIALVSSLFLRGNSDTVQQVRALAIEQNEIIRIADMGSQKARSSNAMNLAVTTQATLASDQKATMSYLTGQKQKIPAKELATGKNAKTDDLLRRAEQANQFDEVFTKELQTELKTYQTNLKKAYDGTSNKKAKALLSDNYNHVKVLISN